MKWFKHENTFNNPKIEVLTETQGIEGYGVYFAILELIASHIEPDNENEWGWLPSEYSRDYLAKKLHIKTDRLNDIIDSCVALNLFTTEGYKIFCPKILERADDYTSRLIKQSSTNSEQTTEEVKQTSKKSSLEEEEEEEEDIEREEDILNNDNKNSDEFSDLKDSLNIKDTPGLTQEFQVQAMEIIKALDVPIKRKSAYFKACKTYPRAKILDAYGFAIDHPTPSARDKMFFWKLNERGKA